MALAETAVITAEEISDNPVWQRLVCLAAKRNIRVFACDFRGTPLKGLLRGFISNAGVIFDELNRHARINPDHPHDWIIAVDASLSEEERQFALAHELGHYARHRILWYFIWRPIKGLEEVYEWEASHFARRLLRWVTLQHNQNA